MSNSAHAMHSPGRWLIEKKEKGQENKFAEPPFAKNHPIRIGRAKSVFA